MSLFSLCCSNQTHDDDDVVRRMEKRPVRFPQHPHPQNRAVRTVEHQHSPRRSPDDGQVRKPPARDVTEGIRFEDIANILHYPLELLDMTHEQSGHHTFMIKPFKYDHAHQPEPVFEEYRDSQDNNLVQMPCSRSNVMKNGTWCWPFIREALMKLKTKCDTKAARTSDIGKTIESCTGYIYEMNSLETLINQVYSPEERAVFMSHVLSNICSLAINVDKICSRAPPLLRINSNRAVTMSQQQTASLLACAFFCLFPGREYRKSDRKHITYQNPNFNTLFNDGPPCKQEKLRCILNYFRRITEKMPRGVITIRRHALTNDSIPRWSKSQTPLCALHLTTNKKIEDAHGLLQVDFANKYIGGGVLGEGCVQEEIRFVLCPEMLVSLLVCEMIQTHECVFLIGCERFSNYQGYAKSFQYESNHIDQTARDSWGRKLCHVVAMDAIAFHDRSEQYNMPCIDRELIKAFTCFYISPSSEDKRAGIATGSWGCGAFNGDRQLKAMIQLMAASQAGRPLAYLAYFDPKLAKSFWEVYKYLQAQRVTVGVLYEILRSYSSRQRRPPLFEYILNAKFS